VTGNLEAVEIWISISGYIHIEPNGQDGCNAQLLMSWQITDPSNHNQVHERSVASGDHSFTAHQDGRYQYCFSNEHWSANSKEVSFNVHGIVYVPESEAPHDPLEKEGMHAYDFANYIMRKLTTTVRTLVDLLSQVKDEQGYIVVRERTHRNTAESTNARVKWWSLFQLIVLVGEGVFQVWWLKRFFEVSSSKGMGILR
jgi:hypothetical protein